MPKRSIRKPIKISKGQVNLFPEIKETETKPVSVLIGDNIDYIKKTFANSCDVVMRPFKVGKDRSLNAYIVYVDGIVNQATLGENFMRSMMLETLDPIETSVEPFFKTVYDHLLTFGEVQLLKDLNGFVGHVLMGQLGLILEGQEVCFAIGIKGGENRGISEPPTEAVIRGPRDGFTEDIRVNSSLVRRRIKSPRLKFEKMSLGTLTQTEINIAYIEGLVMEGLVKEVKERLQRIEIDGILETGYIEEFIEDNPKSLFSQVLSTERPDRVCGNLLEGRVAIFLENTPYVLIVPSVLTGLIQAVEDSYDRFWFSSFIRILRLVTINLALYLPSFYIAISTFHQEMLPTKLFASMAGIREGLPFPVVIETLVMEFTFEVIREAGIRLPRQVGPAVSIVGALVIGDAAVSAGLVSPATVIVVATTAIANLTIPSIEGSNTIRILRFPLMLLAAVFGFLGLVTGLLLILVHLCSLRSFGVPYLSPLAPIDWNDWKDTIIRVPWWLMRRRPGQLAKANAVRQSKGTKSGPPKEKMGK